MKLNNKGFTLVELLAVVVILIVIVSVAIPTISSTLERQKAKKVEAEKVLLASAAELYLTSNAGSLNYKTGSTCSIYTQDLVDGDYINESNISSVGKTCLVYKNGKFIDEDCSETTTKCTGGTLSKNALLSNLVIEGATLSPKFSPDITQYSLKESLAIGTTSVKVTATRSDSKSSISITGADSLSGGNNTIKIVVTAEDGTTKKTYKVSAYVEKSAAQIALDTYASQSYHVDLSYILAATTVNKEIEYGFLNSNFVETFSGNNIEFESITLTYGNTYTFDFPACNGINCECFHASCIEGNKQISGDVKIKLNKLSDSYGNSLTLSGNKVTVPSEILLHDGEAQLYACIYVDGEEISGSCLAWPLKFRNAS